MAYKYQRLGCTSPTPQPSSTMAQQPESFNLLPTAADTYAPESPPLSESKSFADVKPRSDSYDTEA